MKTGKKPMDGTCYVLYLIKNTERGDTKKQAFDLIWGGNIIPTAKGSRKLNVRGATYIGCVKNPCIHLWSEDEMVEFVIRHLYKQGIISRWGKVTG